MVYRIELYFNGNEYNSEHSFRARKTETGQYKIVGLDDKYKQRAFEKTQEATRIDVVLYDYVLQRAVSTEGASKEDFAI